MLPVSVRENGILCLAVKDQALFLVYDVDYYTRGEGRLRHNGKKKKETFTLCSRSDLFLFKSCHGSSLFTIIESFTNLIGGVHKKIIFFLLFRNPGFLQLFHICSLPSPPSIRYTTRLAHNRFLTGLQHLLPKVVFSSRHSSFPFSSFYPHVFSGSLLFSLLPPLAYFSPVYYKHL